MLIFKNRNDSRNKIMLSKMFQVRSERGNVMQCPYIAIVMVYNSPNCNILKSAIPACPCLTYHLFFKNNLDFPISIPFKLLDRTYIISLLFCP